MIDKEIARLDENAEFVVFPENWNALEVFMACFRSLQALQYIPNPEIDPILRYMKVPVRDRLNLISNVRLIESGYMENIKPRERTNIQDRAANNRGLKGRGKISQAHRRSA